jgi:hypothetical protein
MRSRETEATVPFSVQLEKWLSGKEDKTLSSLSNVFGEKSFAVVFLVLMSIPALPLPTGGLTHVFEIITMLLALELVIGRTTIWLPERWKNKKLGRKTREKALPSIIKRVKWFEKFSRPRLSKLMKSRAVASIMGLVIFGLALSAFLAPPFSGLDTLPSLGVVFIALGIILEDIVGAFVGLVTGLVGIALILFLGTALTKLLF